MASRGVHEGPAAALEQLGSAKTVQLQTRKRDGTWVPTPVSLVIEGDRAYFHTYDASAKYKRLRNFPQARLAASTFRGKATGPLVEGRVRVLDGAEAQHARELLAARFPLLHGKMVPWMHRRKGWATVHYEVTFGG
jgi:PPOX class probable F420-dependent enzyme